MQFHASVLRHIESRARKIEPLLSKPDHGWIHHMRRSLGLSLEKLADLCGVATPTIAQAERREAEGKITVETLRKAAEAMNCDFVYMFIPKSDMQVFVEAQAQKKARQILQRADLHMRLEDQKVDLDFEERVAKLQRKLIVEGKIW